MLRQQTTPGCTHGWSMRKCPWCEPKKLKPLKVAEEVLLITRELSKGRSYAFRWYQFRDAYMAVFGAGQQHQTKRSFNQTIGNMLRAQVAAGIIKRIDRGLYIFVVSAKIAHPLYLSPGSLRALHNPSYSPL